MGTSFSNCCTYRHHGPDQEDAPKQASRAASGPVLGRSTTRGGCRTLLHDNSGHDPSRDYEPLRSTLNRGAFGVVRMVRSRRSGVVCALKQVRKARALPSLLRTEVEINLAVDHPNIVRLYNVYEDDSFVYMVFEVCNGGELLEHIIKRNHFTETDALWACGEVLWAVNYLHANGIAHRDLKLENLLLKDRIPDLQKNRVKLIDFGFAKTFVPGKACMRTVAGSAYYIAPEVLTAHKTTGYNEKVDLWSAGVVLYMLLCGSPPFAGKDDMSILALVRTANISYLQKEWRTISGEARSLVEKMLTRDVDRRVSASQAVACWKDVSDKAKAKQVPLQSLTLPTNQAFFDRLRVFQKRNHFEQAARHLVARQLDGDSIKGLQDEFKKLDVNGDGMLSLNEAMEGFQAAGIQDPKLVEEMFRSMDTDGSDRIDYTEFLAANMNHNLVTEAQAWEAFRVLDTDGDGVIDQSDLQVALFSDQASTDSSATNSPRSPEERSRLPSGGSCIADMLSDVDVNGDGRVDFKEFLAMVRRTPVNQGAREVRF